MNFTTVVAGRTWWTVGEDVCTVTDAETSHGTAAIW
jgi:hypothetical protein